MPYPSSIPRPLLVLLAIVCTLAGPASAQAQAHGKGQGHAAKVARDLDDALQPTRAAKKAHWVREIDGVRHVLVLLQPVQIFEEEEPGGLLGVIQFGRTARFFPEDVVNIFEGLFEHGATFQKGGDGGENPDGWRFASAGADLTGRNHVNSHQTDRMFPPNKKG